MTTMTAILIDDEKNALDVLEMQINNYCTGITVLAKYNSGEKGVEAIRQHRPDLVFLDIEMPHKNGFDVLQETASLGYDVIFTTAYDQFAVKAFKYAAVDYLLKPVDILELQAAVEKAKAKKGQANMDEKLKALFQQLGVGQAAASQRIALPVGDAMQLFAPDDIIRCESDSNYTYIFLTTGKKLLLAKTLKETEEALRGLSFFRVHQSHLVNMNHVRKLVKGEGSYLTTSDGANIPISRNKKEAFMESLRKL
jgi:two-component system, LytTR family, response regulator